MGHKHSYFFKIFGVAIVLCGIVSGASAESVHPDDNVQNNFDINEVNSIAVDDNDVNDNDNINLPYLEAQIMYQQKVICAEGTYLKKCGNTEIGFNLLKPMYNSNNTRLTRNYYGATRNNDLSRYEQMRKVFTGTEPVPYKDENNETQIASNADVVRDRETILDYFCDPFDDTIVKQCAPCPGDAKVASSYIKTSPLNTSVEEWHINTLADCYLDEFQDSTGKYVYVPSNENFETSSGAKCYYTGSTSRTFTATPATMNATQFDQTVVRSYP
ncbi:MAG: hypothetical protein IKO56_01430 [Alphaproteobacteria bacterium]|nr:hypothetical protein [Alphaproteobacteria bacterium]